MYRYRYSSKIVKDGDTVQYWNDCAQYRYLQK